MGYFAIAAFTSVDMGHALTFLSNSVGKEYHILHHHD